MVLADRLAEARILETWQVHNWALCEEDFLSFGKWGNFTEMHGRLLQLCCSWPCRAQLLLGGFNEDAPALVLEPCGSCRPVSQPGGCSCSSWWAYGSGFNSPLHTSTFFLLLHLSLSFSCCGVLSCVGQRCFGSGGGGFPQSLCRFFQSHDCRLALVITQELLHTTTTCLACTKVSFTYFGAQSGPSRKRLFSSQ